MPVPLRTAYQKAEAKYHVTTEFASLGLHSAAATGNVGLVEYALGHGQPVNSVLDGVLPLHAACAGGNLQVVKTLIDRGADVNAPRLPRRYSNEKNRDTSVPIVGTSGSTPLHFAAANGNTEVVSLLLLHGAHADRPDKHGVTPELLARQNGWLECADVLRHWLTNKDRDLRERPGGVGINEKVASPLDGSFFHQRSGSMNTDNESLSGFTGRRRIHVKQSIDTALNLLRSSSTDLKSQTSAATIVTTPPASPTGVTDNTDHSSRTIVPPSCPALDQNSRRPSLPHILQPASISPSRSRKTSTPVVGGGSSPQRPASTDPPSASENHEQDLNQPLTGSGRIRKLGSKYSLMNIFKKAQASDCGHSLESSQPGTLIASPASASSLALSTSPNPPSPLANTFFDAQTGFHPRNESASSLLHQVSQQSLRMKEPSNSPRNNSLTMAVDLHNAIMQERHPRSTSGKLSLDEVPRLSQSPNSSPLARLGILRGQDHRRDRSGSGTSSKAAISPYRGGIVFDEDLSIVPGDGVSDKEESRHHLSRAHNRTSSAGQVPGTTSTFRPLRFEPEPSAGDIRQRKHRNLSPPPVLRLSSSVGSLPKYRKGGRVGLSESRLSEEDVVDPVPATVSETGLRTRRNDQPLVTNEEEEDEYGEPLPPPLNGSHTTVSGNLELKSPRITLLMRERGASITSSSDSSLSPILSNDHHDAGLGGHPEFPFSINSPPPEENEAIVLEQKLLRVPHRADRSSSRDRGDSVSSLSTSDSRNNPSLTTSGTTNGSGGDNLHTPYFSSPGRDAFLNPSVDASPIRRAESLTPEDSKTQIHLSYNNLRSAPSVRRSRRSHTPPDINLSSISTHAQAEALVQKAQQDILDMDASELSSGPSTTGPSPLSARLAAYGQSLALERKFRELEAERVLMKTNLNPPYIPTEAKRRSTGDGVERQHSLEHRNRPRFRSRMPTRPSTAEGVSPRFSYQPSPSDLQNLFPQSPRSVSAASPPPRLSIDRDTLQVHSNGVHPDSVSPVSPITLQVLPPSVSNTTLASNSRLHSPDPSRDHLNVLSSSEDLGSHGDGPSMYRVSTTPLSHNRSSKNTATKLTKMGFPTAEQARLQPPKRFGAFRSLVQTLKGKP